MKKVAILSVYDVYNYGSILQTYATQTIISKLGYDNIIVRNDHRNLLIQFMRCFNLPLLTMKLKFIARDFYVKHLNHELYEYFASRKSAFDKFIETHLDISPDWGDKSKIAEKLLEYGYVLVGSDQVWNPMNIGKDFYTMNFVPEGIKRVAYAPSFGVTRIPNRMRERYRNFLSRIDDISVREFSGQKIISDLIGKDVPVVADPTILMPLCEWEKFITQNPFGDKRYIFCYFLGANPSHRDFALRLKDKTGCEIVVLPHSDEICKADFNFGDITPHGVGPKEFVNLIANSEYVCTDSFHATVFSNLFKKSFFSFGRYINTESSASTNSRIPSLLHILGDDCRFINSNIEVTTTLLRPIDYELVSANIENLRKSSTEYLLKALDYD